LVDVKVGDGQRASGDEQGLGLTDAETKTGLPLTNVSFDVDIAQGFADFRIT